MRGVEQIPCLYDAICAVAEGRGLDCSHFAGTLRDLEHVRSPVAWRARLQDAIQPAWTWLAGAAIPIATPSE